MYCNDLTGHLKIEHIIKEKLSTTGLLVDLNQILPTNILRIACETVRRITNETFEVKRLNNVGEHYHLMSVAIFLFFSLG